MALRFIDGFDHYSAAQITRKWSSVLNAAIGAANGRRGTPGLQVWNPTSQGKQYQRILDAQATWVVGCSFTTSVLTPSNSPAPIIELFDGVTSQCSVRMDSTGKLGVYRGTTLLAAQAVATLAINTEYYLEFKATVNNTTGAYELRVNGVAIVGPTTGANTRSSANNTADTIVIGHSSPNNATAYVDDLYVCDGTGSANNSFLGDVRVDATYPAADGANTGLTPSTGTNHAALADENPANDDTDYNDSSTVGNKDTYDFGNISHAPVSIFGVQVNMTAKKDDAGARSICSVTRSGGTDTDGATQVLTTSYVDYREVVAADPNTSAAWTKTNLNAAEFGMKVVA